MKEDLNLGELKIVAAAAQEQPRLKVKWFGQSTATDAKEVIRPFIHRAFDFCEKNGAEMEMDFCGLDYFNSSTVSSFVDAIGQAQLRGIKLAMFYSSENRSQRICFKALAGVVEPKGGVTFAMCQDA